MLRVVLPGVTVSSDESIIADVASEMFESLSDIQRRIRLGEDVSPISDELSKSINMVDFSHVETRLLILKDGSIVLLVR